MIRLQLNALPNWTTSLFAPNTLPVTQELFRRGDVVEFSNVFPPA